ncbi:MAG: biotin--[acetyl-CoA-carboxylase] ligase, partial [Candidatus Omnitrophota bacterium]
LWKHIQALKDMGYEIAAVPHLGYQLLSSPDRLFPSEITSRLNTKFMGKKIYYFDSVASTMDIASQLALKGAAEGTVVIAESQAKGRGRLGRQWFSPKYKGIYLSLILRPKALPQETPVFTLLAAVGICEGVLAFAGVDLAIKWPNDLYLRQKKIGGILTELNAEMDEVRFIVIGIGLNVNNDKKSLVPGATSLKEEVKADTSRAELAKVLLRKLEENYLIFQQCGPQPIIEKWRQHNITLGSRIKVLSHKRHIEGEAQDIEKDGSLLVRCDSGLLEKVTAGDVVHCK